MNWNRLPKVWTKASLQSLLDRECGGELEEFLAELNRESDRLIRTDLKKALQLTRQTTGLEHLLPNKYRAHLYRIWARHYHLSSQYPAAHRLYLKALKYFDRLRDHNSRAKVQKALLDVFMYIRKYDEGIEAGRQALRYYRRIGSALDEAQVMTNLGNLYHRLDQNLKALHYYNRAYEIFRKLGNNYAIALVLFNRANVQANLNELNVAERGYRQAGEIYRSLGMDLAAAQTGYSLAYLAFLKGAYSESLGAFSKAADEFRRLGDERCLALTELDLTEFNLQLNLFSQVIDDAGSVADAFGRMGMSYEQGKALYFAATGYYVFGDFDMAVKLARRSYALFRKEKNRPWQMLCRFLIARIDCRENRYEKSLKAYREMANFYQRQGDVRHHFGVRLAWLEALVISGDRPGAGRMIGRLKQARGKMAGYQQFVFFMLAGDMHREHAEPTQAARYYRRAVALAEKFKSVIFPDDIGRFFWMDKLAAYNRLAALYLDAGQKRRAFNVLEQGRAAAAITGKRKSGQKSKRRIPPHLDAERLRLKAYLRRALIPSGSAVRSIGTISSIRAAENKLWKIERELRKYENIGPDQRTLSYDFDDIMKKLRQGDALVRFICRDEGRGLFLVTRDNFEYFSIESGIGEIRGLLSRFYFLINAVGANGEDQDLLGHLIRAISRKIWQPIAGNLPGIRRLFIIPDGILNRLPFYILEAGDGRMLCEKYDIYMLSGPSEYIGNKWTTGEGEGFEGVSIIAAGDAEMPGASLEALAVSKRLRNCQIFSGIEATARNVLESLERKNGLVHLIAHAAQSYENHLFSRILLSDGPLYPFDIISRPIRANLVVLSGCQTGDPGLYYFNDSLSLAQTILCAGARKVIASYWPIADEVTCRYMDAFYKNLSKEADSYRALKKTILEIKSQSDDIRHWASFYLICR